MRYRAEIDGLRALAVLPVILFHAGFTHFAGGFVGVDVFFVISGYLITGIILRELKQGTFSLIRFYERRARRILPALIAVVATSTIFAALIMTPADLEEYAVSLLGVASFSSNVIFWQQSGYFDSAAELKPMLHTWSLAIEEQFYLFFPLVMMGGWRFARNMLLPILVAGFLASFTLAEVASTYKPDAAFYLLPTRAWELLLGTFAAWWLQVRTPDSGSDRASAFHQTAAAAGLAMIAVAIFTYTRETPYPGIFALMPTLGTVLLILYATPNTAIGRLLAMRPLVALGLISYSLYLWHFPIFALARYASFSEPGTGVMAGLSGLAIILAYFSWRFVERPFRAQDVVPRGTIFTASGGALVAVVFIAIGFIASDGLMSRYNSTDRQLLLARENNAAIRENAFDRYGCFFDYSQSADMMIDRGCLDRKPGRNVILFGDSEAAHYREALLAVAGERGISIRQFTGTSCRPFYHSSMTTRCREFLDIFFSRIGSFVKSGDMIIVSGNWSLSHRRDGDARFESALRDTVHRLSKTDADILLIGNTPSFPADPYNMALRFGLAHRLDIWLPTADFRSSDRIIKRISGEYGARYFAPTRYMCRNSLCAFRLSGNYMFFDIGHLSFIGSRLLVSQLKVQL